MALRVILGKGKFGGVVISAVGLLIVLFVLLHLVGGGVHPH